LLLLFSNTGVSSDCELRAAKQTFKLHRIVLQARCVTLLERTLSSDNTLEATLGAPVAEAVARALIRTVYGDAKALDTLYVRGGVHV
jgi:hypothetical protein